MPAGGRATLYIRSQKEVTPTDMGQPGRVRLSMQGVGVGEYESHLALPEDQRSVVNLVQRVARARQVTVELLDLSKTGHLLERRRVAKLGWTDFPVLVAAGGVTLVGSAAFSEESVIRVLTSGSYAPR